MNETQLQIIISAVDEASDALAGVSDSLSEMGTQATEAAAMASTSWGEFEDTVSTDLAAAASAASGNFEGMSSAALTAADAASTAWQESIASLNTDLAAVEPELAATATTVGEEAGTAAGQGFGGYFKKMIIGYALEQIGSFLSGGIDSAVAAASQGSDKVATLTAQIDQQKAAIQVNEAALQKWNGTTAEVNAAHQKAAANIDAEKAKIVELNQQLATLKTTQDGLKGGVEGIANEFLAWLGTQKQLEAGIQTFMTTLGPLLEVLGTALIAVTLLKVAFSVIGWPLLIAIALAAAIAALLAVWTDFHTQITAFFTDLNAKTGILDLFKQAWQSISENFQDNLLPALEQLWTALQPLKPFMEALAVVIGATLLGAIVLITDAITIAIQLFTDLLTIGTKVATFFTNVLVVALNAVETAINAIISAVSKVGSAGGAIGGAISSAMSAVHLATGGIVNQPTFALIGEAGPEAVIPLSAFAGGSSLAGGGGLGSGGGITININGGSYLDQGGAQQIANALATMIGRQLKLRNYS